MTAVVVGLAVAVALLGERSSPACSGRMPR